MVLTIVVSLFIVVVMSIVITWLQQQQHTSGIYSFYSSTISLAPARMIRRIVTATIIVVIVVPPLPILVSFQYAISTSSVYWLKSIAMLLLGRFYCFISSCMLTICKYFVAFVTILWIWVYYVFWKLNWQRCIWYQINAASNVVPLVPAVMLVTSLLTRLISYLIG
jgi:hypothetical protein